MTIFIKALKDLLNQHLQLLCDNLESKASEKTLNPYDKDLSAKQKKAVLGLMKSIREFESTGNDREDNISVMALIIDSIGKIEKIRGAHDQGADTGNTIKTLTKTHGQIALFYAKLIDFGTKKVKKADASEAVRHEFMLLGRPWRNNPLSVIYYYAAYYLGEEVFRPTSKAGSVREFKEQKWAQQLDELSRLITPNLSPEKHRNDCLARLDALAQANRAAGKIDKSKFTLKLTGLLSAVDINIKSVGKMFYSAPPTRMKVAIAAARAAIEEMSLKEYEPIVAPAPASAAAAASKPRPIPAAKLAAKSSSSPATPSSAGSPIPPMFTASSSGAASTKVKPAPVKAGSAPHIMTSQSPTPSSDDMPESINGDSDDDSAAVPPNPNAGAAAAVVYAKKKTTPPGFFATGAKAEAVTTVAAAAAAAEDGDENVSVDDYSGVEADVSAYVHDDTASTASHGF